MKNNLSQGYFQLFLSAFFNRFHINKRMFLVSSCASMTMRRAFFYFLYGLSILLAPLLPYVGGVTGKPVAVLVSPFLSEAEAAHIVAAADGRLLGMSNRLPVIYALFEQETFFRALLRGGAWMSFDASFFSTCLSNESSTRGSDE